MAPKGCLTQTRGTPSLLDSSRIGKQRFSMTSALSGVLPVFQTPYLADESIDFETLEREIDWLFHQGADGIVMAMVSEVLRLSDRERDHSRKAGLSIFAGSKGPTIISVGAESSHTAEGHARHAEECGAAAVMAIPPVSIHVEEKGAARLLPASPRGDRHSR
jgi:dihydrodipicolinate synthase/N-acetylneuraminate lyase